MEKIISWGESENAAGFRTEFSLMGWLGGGGALAQMILFKGGNWNATH